MPNIQIENVPEETHAVLRHRAALAGQSLQEYILATLVADAATPSLDGVLERVGRGTGGAVTFRDAVGAVREDHDHR